MTIDTSEKAFQNDIIAHLVSIGYHKRGTHNYDKVICLDPELTLKFIQDTQEKEWINPSLENEEKLMSLLGQFPADEMDAHEVSTLVNSPRNNIVECLERV